MKLLVFNSTNRDVDSYNSFTYKFPRDFTFKKGDKIGMRQAQMYNSTFNITSAYGNNTFQIIWNANTTTVYNITIPDGYYTGDDLNFYIQSQFIANKLYTYNTGTGDFTYYVELLTNSVRYAFQLNTFPLPQASLNVQDSTGSYPFQVPTGASWSLPATPKSCQIVLCPGLQTLLGFANTATYPPTANVTTTQSYISDTTPVISVVDTYILTLSVINNNGSAIPNNIFFAVPISEAFGQQLTVKEGDILYHDIMPGPCQYITIQVLDQNYKPVKLNDFGVTFIVVIQES